MAILRKLLKQLNKFWYQFRVLWNTKAIDRLLRETGIDISPEEGIFGVLNQAEEQIVLGQVYDNKLFMALMRKYAEGANKKLIDDVKKQDWHEASRHNGQFFTYANILRKAKKAHENQIKNDTRTDKN